MYTDPGTSQVTAPLINNCSTQYSPPDANRIPTPECQTCKPESPALLPWKPGDASAYEMKFLLDERQAREVESLLAPHLVRDPHALPELGHAYRITTVYCDTPEFEVFHGVGSHRRRKYRLRCYGSEQRVYLERKTKRGQQVRKRRALVNQTELAGLSRFQAVQGWQGDWFHRQLLERRLNPVCCLDYLRTAFIGAGNEGPLRLTFDRNLSGAAARDWLPNRAASPIPFLSERVVCEFKFRGTLPALFKTAIQTQQLTPCGFSKYRNCIQAVAVVTVRGPNHA